MLYRIYTANDETFKRDGLRRFVIPATYKGKDFD
jgi:hypothetical protein